MTACILVVDDVPTNIKVLKVQLEKEYYKVISALSGQEAIKIAQEMQPDIILLDVMMPDMDGFEVCELLKANKSTSNIPIIFVTALDDIESRIKGLNYGAEDFLSKPINDIALLTRIKSISRLKAFSDELEMQYITSKEIENTLDTTHIKKYISNLSDAKTVIIDDDKLQSEQVSLYLKQQFSDVIQFNDEIERAPIQLNDYHNIDLIIVNIQSSDYDGLRLCSQLRNNQHTKRIPILILIDEDNISHLVKGMEIGVNDYLTMPINEQELLARAKLQIRKKRYQDALYTNLMDCMKMAVTDPLTKCYNRFYFDTHLKNKIIGAQNNQHRMLSIIMIDIDFFKKINDTHGHLVGDKILQQIAQLLSNNIRASDLLVRFGGEEFIILLSDVSSLDDVILCAKRINYDIAKSDFSIDRKVTVSIGISTFKQDDSSSSFIKRADQNLYLAKENGRNQIEVGQD